MKADGSGDRKIPLSVSATQLDWCPDGTRIAIRVSRIWVANADGTNARVLAGSCAPEMACASSEAYHTPRWSPDGQQLLVIRDGRVVILQADGSGAIELELPSPADPDPRWSSDGSRIVFAGGVESCPADLFLVRRDGTDLVRFTSTAEHEWGARWVRMP